MVPSALVKMRRRNGRWQDIGQRFGFFNRDRQAAIAGLPQEGRIWMHAVSVGEVGVARKIIVALLKQTPSTGLVLTTTTPTGHRLALEIEQAFPGQVVALYSPLDLPFVASRLFDQIRPRQIVLVEAEVWPNTVAQAADEGIPVMLVNARLSPRSERSYLRYKNLMAPIWQMLSRVCVQEPEDIDRWTKLGVDPQLITFTGSVKYDPQGSAPVATQVEQLSALLHATGLNSRPLLLAASTHPGEEKELGMVFKSLAVKHPGLGFLIVPRHYERGPSVQAELDAIGLPSLLRSTLDGTPRATDVLIVDSTGELKAWQELATVVVIGKSFLAEGGQNPAEAVMAGKPVVFGPHMENFLPLVDLLLTSQGAIQVAKLEELEPVLSNLFSNPTQCDTQANAGKAALMRHDGATLKTVAVIRA